MNKDNDIVLTDNGEFMTIGEAKAWNECVFRKATKKESDDYWAEVIAMEKQEQEELHSGSYHELSN